MDEISEVFKRALDLLKVAESNFNSGFFPDSINRSYYAAFYAAKALLLKKSIITKTHSGTIGKFGREYVANGIFDRDIARFFSELEEDRRNADYDVSFKATKNKAIIDLKNAKKFIKECEKFL